MKRIVIAGHRGRMGAMLLERFSRRTDIDAVGLDLPYLESDLAEACRGAHAVLLCVPASAIADMTAKFAPYMDAGTILADITSVKERPMRDMESLWPGPVVGTHPLFGPRPDEAILQQLHAGGQTIVMITHDEGIAAAAPRQMRMEQGRLFSIL